MALTSKLVPKYLQNEVNYLSESGQARWNIYVLGSGANNSTAPAITVNGTSNLSTYGRGVTVVVWDTSMAVLSTTVYDIYAYDSEQTRLATDLNALSGNKIFAIVSYDAINTNANLNAAMTTKRSQLWNTKYVALRNLTGGVRYPYACIGTTLLGIVSEQIWKDGGSDPRAIATWSFEDWDTAGNTGYGPIVSAVSEVSGRGYPFFNTGDVKNTLNPQTNEIIRFTAEVKTDNTGFNEGSHIYLWIWNNAWNWAAASGPFYTNEYVKAELEIAYNGSASEIICGIYYYNPNSGSNGIGYARNIQIQKVGYSTQPSTARSKMGPAVITSRKFIESPQKFDPRVPDTYWNLWSSGKNLLSGQTYGDQLTGAGTSSETVRWFDRNLTTSAQKFLHWKTTTDTSGENMYSASGFVPVDHTKMYYGSVWMYNFNKTGGNNYVGTHTLNSGGSYINTRDQGGTYNAGTNPYFIYPGAGSIAKNKWNLVDCWFLPSTFTQAEATDFYNKYWQKTHSKYNNPGTGDPSGNSGNCPLVWMDSSVSQVLLRFLDYYNGTNVSKTWWALPMIVEVSPMTISNYEMSSWHLKEV